VSDEFAHRNLFLWTTLGAISIVRQGGRSVRSDASGRRVRAAVEVPSTVDGHEALLAALGVIALSRTLFAHWRASAPRRSRARRPPLATRPVALRALLE
jgi:hypothetical protein